MCFVRLEMNFGDHLYVNVVLDLLDCGRRGSLGYLDGGVYLLRSSSDGTPLSPHKFRWKGHRNYQELRLVLDFIKEKIKVPIDIYINLETRSNNFMNT